MIFFLIYGVEVFFKVSNVFFLLLLSIVDGIVYCQPLQVRGGFTVAKVPAIITRRSQEKTKKKSIDHQETGELLTPFTSEQPKEDEKVCGLRIKAANWKESEISIFLQAKVALPTLGENQMVNSSQLHQSRLGLLSQALMLMITTGFLFAETLEEFWKTKVNLTSRNTHDIVFRTIEIGIALWFPCVLWNCIRPEQLWCLNPKKILERFPPLRENKCASNEARNLRKSQPRNDSESSASSTDGT